MRRVVITGIGVITPIGNSIDIFWNNLINGVCGIGEIQSIPTEQLASKIAAEVKGFNTEDYNIDKSTMRRSDKFTQYALAAASQAMQDSKLDIEPERLGVYIGSGIGGIQTFSTEHSKLLQEGAHRISPLFIPMMIPNIASGNVAIAFNAEGPCLPIVTACASGSHAIGEAYRSIKHNYADAIIAGGSEAAICPITIGGFVNCKALSRSENPNYASLPFNKNRQGFVLGEGAGVVVLEELEHAKQRGAKIYAEIVGYSNTCDAYHYTAPKPDGSCAARAMKQALKEAQFADNQSLYINAHGTGTPLNDVSETAAIKIALGNELAYKTPISSNKSMFGHTLGAAGAIELVASVLTTYNDIIPPTIGLDCPDSECDLDYVPNEARKKRVDFSLSNSLGFGGHNASVVIKKYNL